MDLSDIRAVVFRAKPGLQEVYEREGKKTLTKYASQSLNCINAVTPESTREFLDVFFSIVSSLFSPVIAKSAVEQLQKSWYVSTAEHHGPISHSFSVSGLMVQASVNREKNFKNVIVLACAGISANNSSFPRGHIFHTRTLVEKRLHLLSLQYHQTPVSHLPAYSSFAIQRLTKEIGEYDKLNHVIEKIYSPVVDQNNYSEQVSITNYNWWQQLPGQSDVNMLYIDLEKIVTTLLLTKHCFTTTEIYSLMFTKTGQEAWKEHMVDITGAFSKDGLHGTFLFWGVSNGHRISLRYDKGSLVSSDGTVSLALTPESVAIALEKKEILPSLALSYSLLSFYYGLTLGGGFSQIDYLPRMQQAYNKILKSISPTSLAVLPTATNYLSSDYAFLLLSCGEDRVLASALDIFLYNTDSTAESVVKLCNTVTVAEAIDNLLPEMYKIIAKQEVPYFLSVTPPLLYV